MFSAYFTGFLRVRKVRKILGVFEVFLGIFEKTKEKKDRACLCPSTDRVRFRLFPSTVWAGREYGLDWFRVRFRYPRR